MSVLKNILVSTTLLLTGCKQSELAVVTATTPTTASAKLSNLPEEDIKKIKAELTSIAVDTILIGQHKFITKSRDFDLHKQHDENSRQNIVTSKKFLTDFAKEKNLLPAGENLKIDIDELTGMIKTNSALINQAQRQVENELYNGIHGQSSGQPSR